MCCRYKSKQTNQNESNKPRNKDDKQKFKISDIITLYNVNGRLNFTAIGHTVRHPCDRNISYGY